MFAKQVSRMTTRQTEIAMFEAEVFGQEIGYLFTGLEHYAGQYRADFINPFNNDDDNNWTTADVVRCPHCRQIQVCYGQYGDPEHENLVCTQCQQIYKMEPF